MMDFTLVEITNIVGLHQHVCLVQVPFLLVINCIIRPICFDAHFDAYISMCAFYK